MEAYSIDLRRRVVEAHDRGMPVIEITATFSIHQATVSRWLQRRNRTGTIWPLNQTPVANVNSTTVKFAFSVVRGIIIEYQKDFPIN